MFQNDEKPIVIPTAVIKRLPKYHRNLKELLKKDVERVSSRQLGGIVGVSAPQLRQDLNHFGNFGQQGYGYNVEKLYNALSKVMGIEKKSEMVLVGVGQLGQALINSTDFSKRGFSLKAVFDINPKIIGFKINQIKVRSVDDLDNYIREHNIEIGVITVPKEAAQGIANRMIESGVKGIWNFAPVDLEHSNEIAVENEHLTEGLLRLSFNIKDKKR